MVSTYQGNILFLLRITIAYSINLQKREFESPTAKNANRFLTLVIWLFQQIF